MKNKLTVAQEIHSRKINKPPTVIYRILAGVWKMLFMKKYGVTVTYKTDIRKDKGPYILVSNHASRADYIFTGVPMLPNCCNYVAGYNEFHRSHLAFVFKLLRVIPKKNFVPDVYTIKQVSRVIQNGGRVVLFPEGMSSISGANQPVAIGTGKFIKHFGVPVYYSVIKGGYLTTPKYNLKDRFGKVEVTFDLMFTPEQLKTLTPEQIEDKMNELLYHDDYAWNKEKGYEYKNDGNIAGGLHTLLYQCPKCGKEFTMKGEGNTIRCEACGNGATLADTYAMTPFDDTCVIPETQTAWFNMQRENVKKQVQDEAFTLTEKVKLGCLPDYEKLKDLKTSEIVGEGTITLNRQGFTYEGTKNGQPFSFHIKPSELPTYGMCTDVSRFYTFYKGEFMEFYPEREVVEKWFLATEEIHRLTGGKWQDFKFEK